ncbi:MAG: YciI family protein [Phenylobacterium sp.]|uniref:YciI family protein n=1 Tax=Phenylobacterium sp. TaxID=1871053 RepID=UPI002733563A|nr:YciI family protein [Phenylobacterium sp.]MDP3747065.1 YciI family protein [Phenylobacterium sp.]
MRPALAASILALAATPAMAQPATPATIPTIYVIHYKTGPAWLVGKPLRDQPMGPHGAYMRKLFAEGRMLAAGPTVDAEGAVPLVDGGVILLRAASLDEAKAVMAADPAITAGLFVGEVRTWRVAFSKGEPLAPPS